MRNKILFILLAFIIVPLCALAQNGEREKGFPTSTKDAYFYSHQVSVGYGFGSAIQWLNSYDGNLDAGHLYDGHRYWGGINIKYIYRYSDKITFGMSYTYTGVKRDISYQGSIVGQSTVNISAIMPEFKSDWYKTDLITLYSRAAIGVAITSVSDDYLKISDNNNYTNFQFAFQASPIGFEIGIAFAYYVEVGFGYQGIIVTGVRYNF